MKYTRCVAAFITRFDLLKRYHREGNSVGVRIAAFEGLLLTRWFSAKLLRYLLLTIQYDASRVVRRSIARALLESLMLQFAMGEIKSAKEDNVLVEEDGSAQDKSKELLQKKNEINGFIKTLRKDRDLGKSKEFRDHIMPILLYELMFPSFWIAAHMLYPGIPTSTLKFVGACFSSTNFSPKAGKRRYPRLCCTFPSLP